MKLNWGRNPQIHILFCNYWDWLKIFPIDAPITEMLGARLTTLHFLLCLLFCSCLCFCQKSRERCYISRLLLDHLLLTASSVKEKTNVSPTNAAVLQWCKWDQDLLQVQSTGESRPESRAKDIRTLSSSMRAARYFDPLRSVLSYAIRCEKKVEEKKQASGAPERSELLCNRANYSLHCRVWVIQSLDLKVLLSLNEDKNENVQCVPTHLLIERTLTLSFNSLKMHN